MSDSMVKTTPGPAAEDEFTAFVRARTASLLRLGYLLTGDQHLAEELGAQ